MPIPTVSVVITNYNYAAYVLEAVDSVLNQSLPPREIFVVDDGSTDDSLNVLRRRYGDNPQVVLIHKSNEGQMSAFIAGVAAATAEIVAFLDADDRWKPNYLAEIAAIYERMESVDFVFTNLEFFGARNGYLMNVATNRDYGLSVLLGAFGNHWPSSSTSAFSFRRELLKRLLDLPGPIVNAWRTCADFCLVCGSDILGGHKYGLAKPLVWYRTHDRNAWFGRKQSNITDLRFAYRVERMLEHYREVANITPHLLKHSPREFSTKSQPTWREFRKYVRLLNKGSMSWTKQMRHASNMFRHYLATVWRSRD